jgi:hypothetical protein
MFKIEKGIPIPEPHKRNGYKSKYPFSQLEPGDSFLVPTNKEQTHNVRNRVSAASHHYAAKHGWKFSIRVMVDGIRVWRTS